MSRIQDALRLKIAQLTMNKMTMSLKPPPEKPSVLEDMVRQTSEDDDYTTTRFWCFQLITFGISLMAFYVIINGDLYMLGPDSGVAWLGSFYAWIGGICYAYYKSKYTKQLCERLVNPCR